MYGRLFAESPRFLICVCVSLFRTAGTLAQSEQTLGGIGIVFSTPTVIRGTNVAAFVREWVRDIVVVEGLPACKAGIKTGDIITQVDSKSLSGRTASEIADLLRGSVGSQVSLRILRNGRVEPLKIELVRQEIHLRYHTVLPKCNEEAF